MAEPAKPAARRARVIQHLIEASDLEIEAGEEGPSPAVEQTALPETSVPRA